MKKIIVALSVAILILANSAFAANRTFIKEYTYLASDLDSKVSSRAIALEQVKRALLEELGTYLVSKTEVKDFQLTKDQITTLTAGIVSAQIIDEKWDGRSYYLKAKISADPDQVAKSVDSLRNDVRKTGELEDAKKKADDAMREVERLKKELALAKADTNTQGEYIHAINKLSASDWLNKAHKFFTADAFQDAIDAFSKAIELDPKNVYAYRGRGNAYSVLVKYQQAIDDYTKLIELNPKDWSSYKFRGDTYKKFGKYQQAIGDYTRVIEMHPEEKYTYITRGNTYKDFGKYQQAIDDYTRVIEMHPKDENTYVSAYMMRAYVFRNYLYDNKRAIDDFTKVIELHPKDKYWYASAYADRGAIYNSLDDYEHAVADFTKQIELYPKGADGYRNRGIVYEKWGKTEQATADLKTAARLGHKMVQKVLKTRGITW